MGFCCNFESHNKTQHKMAIQAQAQLTVTIDQVNKAGKFSKIVFPNVTFFGRIEADDDGPYVSSLVSFKHNDSREGADWFIGDWAGRNMRKIERALIEAVMSENN